MSKSTQTSSDFIFYQDDPEIPKTSGIKIETETISDSHEIVQNIIGNIIEGIGFKHNFNLQTHDLVSFNLM